MLANLKSSIVNFNSRLSAKNTEKSIKAQLSEIKGFYLKDFYISNDSNSVIAVDKSLHKLVILINKEQSWQPILMHCSDLKSVHHYQNGTAVKSYTNSFLHDCVPGHTPIAAKDKTKSFLKIKTNRKHHRAIIFHFDNKQSNESIGQWFDICRQLIAKAEQTTEAMNSRIQVMR